MALKIVTGGTTGAADGTLVSSSNKIVFGALDTVVDCHIRADDDTYSADASFSMPSDGAVQVSFDGGSTWKEFANNPASYGVDIGDLNVAIKLRQHANATASTGTFQTDATTPAATALADVTGFTATGGGSQVALSWSAVTNRSFYQIDRATNSGFTTGVALDISPGQTTTSFTDTGRTDGTTYYYRIKALGRVRYKDSANYATANATAAVSFNDTFTGSAVVVTSHTADTGQGWQSVTSADPPRLDGSGHLVRDYEHITGVQAALVSTPLGDDIIVEAGLSLATGAIGDQVGFLVRSNDTVSGSGAFLHPYLYHDTDGVKAGIYTGSATLFFTLVSSILGSYTAGTVYTFRVEVSGGTTPTVVAKLNGTTIGTYTPTVNTVGGKIGVRIANTGAESIDFLRVV